MRTTQALRVGKKPANGFSLLLVGALSGRQFPFTETHLSEGIEIGRFNSQGVTTPGAYDGGQQERLLANAYDEWSRKVATRWPNTARVHRDLARIYTEWAEREDERVELWRNLGY